MHAVFDLEDLPRSDRASAWEEAITRATLPMNCRFLDPGDSRGRLVSMFLGAGEVLETSYSALIAERTPRLIRRDDPEQYVIAIPASGVQGIEQARRQATVRPGEMVLYDSSLPLTASATVTRTLSRALVLQFPKQSIRLPEPRVKELLAVPLPTTAGLGKLLAGLLRGMTEEYQKLSPRDLARVGRNAVDLAAVVLGHFANRTPLLPPESRRRVLFLECVAFVERHLGDPDLSPAVVAQAHGISARYLQQVFREQGTTPSSLIREHRLARCRRDLADPALHAVPVHAIGARWGFPRPSEFSRAFRKREGVAPGGYRLLVMSGAGRRRCERGAEAAPGTARG